MKNKQEEYKQLATDILSLVGGEENVDKVIHCVTRLRFYLNDRTKADQEALEELSGVMGVVEANGQYQVIVGQAVDDIYEELMMLLSNKQEDNVAEKHIT